MPDIEVQQDTVDEVVRTGRELVDMCREFMPADGQLTPFARAVIEHKTMLTELAREL